MIYTNTSDKSDKQPSGTSDSTGGMFNGLHSVKRGNTDVDDKARRTSLSEQTAKPGVIGQMWNK